MVEYNASKGEVEERIGAGETKEMNGGVMKDVGLDKINGVDAHGEEEEEEGAVAVSDPRRIGELEKRMMMVKRQGEGTRVVG